MMQSQHLMKTMEQPRARPRPLALHLALQTLLFISSKAALPILSNGSLPWRPNLKNPAAALAGKLLNLPLEEFSEAIDREAERRLKEFSAGVLAYQNFDRGHDQEAPPVVWQQGQTRLLHYGAQQKTRKLSGAPVLVVPSLINRSNILDLTPERSLMRNFQAQGLDAYLIDWGEPADEPHPLGLDDYIAVRLSNMVDYLTDLRGCSIGLLGYCMGGLLALPIAQQKPEQVSALALMATPWDFHQPSAVQGNMILALRPQMEQIINIYQALPIDVLQAMFATLSPFQTTEKFRKFARLMEIDPGSERARLFVMVEDWLNDGVSLSGPVARECLFNWYGHNLPFKGEWRVADRPVRPDEVRQPTLCIVPAEDRIVPPESAKGLSRQLVNNEEWDLKAGHIGMVTSKRASQTLFEPLGAWFAEQV